MRFHRRRLAERWTLYECFGAPHRMGVLPAAAETAERQMPAETSAENSAFH